MKVLAHGGGGGGDAAFGDRPFDGGGGACRIVGKGGECLQPACGGRGGSDRGGGVLLQLAHAEGAPAPGDGACAAVGTNMPGAENLGLLL